MNEKISFRLKNGDLVNSNNGRILLLAPELLQYNLDQVENVYINFINYFNEDLLSDNEFLSQIIGKDYSNDTNNNFLTVVNFFKNVGSFVLQRCKHKNIRKNQLSQYEEIFDLNSRLSIAKKNKYGFIKNNGKVVIPFIYDEFLFSHNGLFIVEKNGIYYLIDRRGRETLLYNKEKNKEFIRHMTSVSSFPIAYDILTGKVMLVQEVIYNTAEDRKIYIKNF